MPISARQTYHLEVCPGDNLQGPSDAEIENAIRSLPGGVPSFVIMTKKKNHFMQAGGCVSEGYELEYQEVSRDGHWQHEDSSEVPVDVVVQALQWYAQDDDEWRRIKWKRLLRSEIDKRKQEAWQEWKASQPAESFLKGLLRGLLEIGMEKFTPKTKRPRRTS